ncbi:uncharacterized protein LOC127881540 [Dreissena polymorpha]|uniref:RING-type domain-containing protein n=1 Tax=Dreissena polymorpha TaxID=45954 RepID=A0A9D4MV71_DREPO|nr:uncharacterized protein LOC127881540 [Dreissena polymorpha]KAH3881787.1 hypothetical protein DPMN_005714 [Dreissena polymorpha]
MDEGCGGARPKNLYNLEKNRKTKDGNPTESSSSIKLSETRSSNKNSHNDKHKCNAKHVNVKNTSSNDKSSLSKGSSHDIVKAKEQEYLTAKERWKKSGLALRRYIAEKLGFKNEKKIKVPVSEGDTEASNREVVPSKSSNEKSQPFSTASISDSHLYKKPLPLTEMSRSKSFLEKIGFRQDKRTVDNAKHKANNNKDFELEDMENSSCCMDLSTWSEGSYGFGRQDCSDIQSSCDGFVKSSGAKAKVKTDGTQCSGTSTKKGLKLNSSKKEKTEKIKNTTKKRKEKTQAKCTFDFVSEGNLAGGEFIYDPVRDEIICRKIERDSPPSPPDIGSQNGARSSQRHMSSAMSNAVAGLQYAIPYLPERFRRLGTTSETHDTNTELSAPPESATRLDLHTKAESVNSRNITKTNKKPVPERRDYVVRDNVDKTAAKDNNLPVKTHRQNNKHKKESEDEEHWKKRLESWANAGASVNEVRSDDNELNGRLFALSSIRDEKSDDALFENEYAGQQAFESSLEDPFHVRERNRNNSIDLCTGLLDLVNDIDQPLADPGGSNSGANVCQRAFDRRFLNNSSHSSVSNHRLCSSCMRGICLCHDGCFVPCGEDGLECRSSDDDLDQKYVEQILERSRHRSSGDSFELSFRNNLSSPLEEPSSKSRDSSDRPKCAFEDVSSPGSGFSSLDSSLDADDEFECECEHCQMMRSSHNHYTEQLALTQPLSLDLSERSQGGYASAGHDSGLHFSFGDPNMNSRSGDSSFDSLSRRMFLDDYDYLLMERPESELDWHWLTIDNTPLSVMLEDVIQQMLSVQPDLLSEQAAPPASSSVIDSLPTICLTQELIEQHQCCAICLCPCELEELMTQLLCQHIFHPLCIQAWLCKSGTCPVCRGKVGAPDQS